MLGRLAQGLTDRERLVELRHRLVGARGLDVLRRGLPGRRAQPVDAEPPRQLAEPGADCLVVAELVQPLVGAREDLLEHVLGVVVRKSEGLDRDRVHVA